MYFALTGSLFVVRPALSRRLYFRGSVTRQFLHSFFIAASAISSVLTPFVIETRDISHTQNSPYLVALPPFYFLLFCILHFFNV